MNYYIPSASTQVEVIDEYITAGYSYEEAYQLWEEDYNTGKLNEEWEEDLEEVEEDSSRLFN